MMKKYWLIETLDPLMGDWALHREYFDDELLAMEVALTTLPPGAKINIEYRAERMDEETWVYMDSVVNGRIESTGRIVRVFPMYRKEVE